MSLSVNTLSTLLFTPDESFQHLLKMLLREIGITGVLPSYNFQEAVSTYNQEQPDICIVDTGQLTNGKSGVEFANLVREDNCVIPIIFLVDSFYDTSYEQVKAFDQSSVLSKEVSKLQLLQAVKYSLLQVENSKLVRQVSEQRPSSTQSNNTAADFKDGGQVFFRVGNSFRAIKKEKISFFFAENRLTYARVGEQNYPTTVQLKILENGLGTSFIRCHRKYLLNEHYIESISVKESRVKVDGQSLPIGTSYRKPFFERLNLLK
jgi:DNA-binding LytR/AlgR family response regulator